MAQVVKLGYAGFDTPNVEVMLAYYTDVLGLTLVERGDGGVVYLRSVVEHHTISLHPAPKSRLRHIGLQLGGGQSLREVATQLSQQGLRVELRMDAEPGVAELLQLSDPEGFALQLYSTMRQANTGFPEHGIVPEKLGHIALAVQSASTMCDFYQNLLGFRVSDWIENFFVFMRCNPDHHALNFLQVKSKYHQMHHIAFQLKDWGHVQRACDHLSRHGIQLVWGPGRHGAGHNIFTYHHDPDGHIVELFTELDIIYDEEKGYFEPRPWHEEYPQGPRVWKDAPHAINHWGPLPSPEFMFMT
jgi:catechol 2,3-dioxygenase-like lactoylglutathione lyase family enzyme